MVLNLNNFRQNLTFGGARPNLFQVEITNPINSSSDLKLPFLVKAASIPASTTGKIPAGYMGRFVNIPGDREYADWTVTIYNDEDFLVRNALEAWSNDINTHRTNNRGYPAALKAQGQVSQLARNGSILRTYKFTGMFPLDIAAIELAWETQNTIEEFQVTFTFDEFDVDGGTTGRPLT